MNKDWACQAPPTKSPCEAIWNALCGNTEQNIVIRLYKYIVIVINKKVVIQWTSALPRFFQVYEKSIAMLSHFNDNNNNVYPFKTSQIVLEWLNNLEAIVNGSLEKNIINMNYDFKKLVHSSHISYGFRIFCIKHISHFYDSFFGTFASFLAFESSIFHSL